MNLLDQDEKQIIIERLKEIRRDNDITLKELGSIMGISEATASRYESGGVESLFQKRTPTKTQKRYKVSFGKNTRSKSRFLA